MNQQFIKAFPTTLSYIQESLTDDKIIELREVVELTEKENPLVNPSVWDCDATSSYPYVNKHLDTFIAKEFIDYITGYLDHEHGLLPAANLSIISWHNKYSQNQFQEAHDHIAPMVIACGVYILDQDADSTCRIQFLDPNKKEKNACGITDIKETPQFNPNDLVLFPPYLQHKVLQQTTDNYRTTVSFNVAVKFEN